MLDWYIRVAAATPKIKPADCVKNAEEILSLIKKADEDNISLLCLPELCITGCTCGDLFLQKHFIDSALQALHFLVNESATYNVISVVGLPYVMDSKLYNVAAVFCRGELLGIVPKTSAKNFGGAFDKTKMAPFINKMVPFGTDLQFKCSNLPNFTLAVEIGEDLWLPSPPSIRHAAHGATVIANPSASCETAGKAEYRRMFAGSHSARLNCGYVRSEAGYGESTTDMVFSGHNIICENGEILHESLPFGGGWAVSEIDLHALEHERRYKNTFSSFPAGSSDGYGMQYASLDISYTNRLVNRDINSAPFVPKANKRQAYCEEILNIQSYGLAKRLEHTASQKAVIGISGGLDSSLAFMVTVRALELLNRPLSDILAVTMPCFGTSERTRKNAHDLCEAKNVFCLEVDITKSVEQHLKEIEHNSIIDITFENSQARMRTLTLMDLANKYNGIVIGTGNLSELALGWATFNGDHMSMYAVNAGVPKTLVRCIIQYLADTEPALTGVLTDILDTPISPELLGGSSYQKTEDIIGPYELHDFFIYHIVHWGRSPSAVYWLACNAFEETAKYKKSEILKWLKVFCSRFFAQQFKRNCMPDGPKAGLVSFSPRGDWKMPSDASGSLWLAELNSLNP